MALKVEEMLEEVEGVTLHLDEGPSSNMSRGRHASVFSRRGRGESCNPGHGIHRLGQGLGATPGNGGGSIPGSGQSRNPLGVGEGFCIPPHLLHFSGDHRDGFSTPLHTIELTIVLII
jgi:hypothetical protein